MLSGPPKAERVVLLPLALVDADPNQPRKLFSEERITNLASSILQHGQLQPILVRQKGERFVIFEGELRFRATQHAGLATIRALVQSDPGEPEEDLIKQLVVNCQREDLNPIELADSYGRLMQEGRINATELANKLARSKGHVSSILSLLTLKPEVRELVASGRIAMGSAAEIARIPAEKQHAIAIQVASGELNRGQLQKRSQKSDKAADKGLKRVSLQFGDVTAQFAGASRLNLDRIQELLEQLMKECRRAKKQGLDVSTLAAVLRDRFPKTGSDQKAVGGEDTSHA